MSNAQENVNVKLKLAKVIDLRAQSFLNTFFFQKTNLTFLIFIGSRKILYGCNRCFT